MYIHRRTIRFGETDAARIVYTVRFFDYALDAIDSWYADVLGADWYALNTTRGMTCPFVHAELDFTAPLRPGDLLETSVAVSRMGRSSLSFRVEGNVRGVTAFVGDFTVVFTGLATMKSMAIPGEFVDKIDQYRQACAGAGSKTGKEG